MTTEPIRMTIPAFIALCERANEEATTTNEIHDLWFTQRGDRAYDGYLRAEWEGEGVTFYESDLYEIEEKRGGHEITDFDPGEKYRTEPRIDFIDEDGNVLDSASDDFDYWAVFTENLDMVDRNAIYDHSTMPSSPTIV